MRALAVAIHMPARTAISRSAGPHAARLKTGTYRDHPGVAPRHLRNGDRPADAYVLAIIEGAGLSNLRKYFRRQKGVKSPVSSRTENLAANPIRDATVVSLGSESPGRIRVGTSTKPRSPYR